MAKGPWLLLQLADAAFPAGGFAHSGGLESMAQQGEVRDDADLEGLLSQSLWQAGRAALPFVTAAHASPGDIDPIDARCHALLSGHVSSRASQKQGRALVDTAARIFDHRPLSPLTEATRAKRIKPHLAPSFGALSGLLGLGAGEARAAFLYQTARGFLSAAVRLGLCGPHQAQSMQHRASPLLDRVLEACEGLAIDEARQVSPIVELFANTHDRLYSRLFLT